MLFCKEKYNIKIGVEALPQGNFDSCPWAIF